MGLGDMLGKATEMMGGVDGIMEKMNEMGIDPAELAGLDADAITGFLAEKGIDLSMLEGLGLSVDDILEKIKGA